MNVDLFDFDLPETLIAQRPAQKRTESRLMTLDKRTGEIGHHRFTDLAQYLRPGDCLVLNDTKVIPARLFGRKRDTGAKIEVLLLRDLGENRWETLVRPGKRLKKGNVIDFFAAQEQTASGEASDDSVMSAEVGEETEAGGRVLKFAYQGIFQELLDRIGQMPLPPYIKEELQEKERYQTVYARKEGSAAAPTAGLHFTKSYLQDLEQQGIRLAYLTLHVGLGTFRPVSVENVEEHRMHAEYYELPESCAAVINETRESGGRVVAVGTTSARTLETAAARMSEGILPASKGWTDIFIYPGYEFRLVDALLTNFHLPRSTLLMMISAFAGRERVLAAYREAVRRKYRFFSFGDAMFIY